MTVGKDTFKTLEFLNSNWLGRLVPVWILLAVLFLVSTGTLFNNLLSGEFICMHDWQAGKLTDITKGNTNG